MKYGQWCPIAKAAEILGERWTLLVVRELLLGPRRYTDLLEELPGITTNLLAKRLKELERAGLVARVEPEPGDPVRRWRLTEDGAALEPAIMELARWGGRRLDRPRRGDRVDLRWAMLSLKRRYLGGRSLVVEVDAGERRFELALEPAYLRVSDRASGAAALRLSGDADVVREALFMGGAARLRAEGRLRVAGAEADWEAFLAAFAPRQLPPPPAVPAARSTVGA